MTSKKLLHYLEIALRIKVIGCTGYLAHPFKKTDLPSPIPLFSGHSTRVRGKGNLFLALDGSRKLPLGKKTRGFLATCTPGRDSCPPST